MLDVEFRNRSARTHLEFRLSNNQHNTKGHIMCSKITCNKCGKATWTGCGQHVEQALAGVKPADRCTCK